MSNAKNSPYGTEFYQRRAAACLCSARVVVPLVIGFVAPTSVVDVGCGDGAWLSVFRDHGIKRLVGLDGPHIDRSLLKIPPGLFRSTDLKDPFSLDETFDLCVSLEVGEHLPGYCAPQFVASLVNLAPVILFSAAIPYQGGKCHQNEQWPQYWLRLFSDHGYIRLDPFRRLIWQNREVSWWYQQNIFLYVAERHLEECAHFKTELERSRENKLTLISEAILYEHCGLRALLRRIAQRAWNLVPGRRVEETSRRPSRLRDGSANEGQ